MELSDFAIIKLVPFVTGDNNLSRQRKGPELVELFCSCGYRDIYDLIMEDYPNYQKIHIEILLVVNILKIDS